jgi:hypothetical protein
MKCMIVLLSTLLVCVYATGCSTTKVDSTVDTIRIQGGTTPGSSGDTGVAVVDNVTQLGTGDAVEVDASGTMTLPPGADILIPVAGPAVMTAPPTGYMSVRELLHKLKTRGE